jgi:hypothetical protein
MVLIRTKLFETILAMTASERDRIPDFILSPVFFAKEDKILELYILLRKEVEKHEQGAFCIQSEEELYKLLSPSKEWNQKTFDSMESRLLNVIKKAIVYQYAGIDRFKLDVTKEDELNIEIKQLLFLAQFYRERKLLQQFDNTINRIKILQNSSPLSNEHYYTSFLTIQEEYEVASLYRMPERNNKRVETLESLDLYYLINKLSILIQFEPPIKEDIEKKLRNLENLSDEHNPLFNRIIDLYRKAFTLIWYKNKEEETILEEYLTALDADAHLLPAEQQKSLYTYARNFCAIKYKTGEIYYLKTLFELIKKNLKTGLLYHKDGAMSEGILHNSLQNIVAIALKLQESEWALKFLKEHRTKIIAPNAAEQERFYHFNLACYHFQRKEYDEALLLLKTDFDDKLYQLMARALEIKLYFEKPNKKEKEIEFLESRINAFEVYLSRNEVTPLDKTGYRNFIKLTKKMNKQKRITTKDLEDKNSIAEREWIIEKAKTLNDILKGMRYSFARKS